QPLADQALAAAEQTGRPPLLVLAHHAQALIRFFAGDLAGAREHFGRALALYEEATQLPAPLDNRIRMLPVAAWTAWHLGRLAAVRAGLERIVALGQRLALEFHLGLLADAHACAGNVAEALAVLADAEGALPGEEVWRADTLRRRAELLARAGADTARVEATFP